MTLIPRSIYTRILAFLKAQVRMPYFPFFLAWTPVVTFYVHNVSELTWHVLIVPLALVTVVTCVLLVLGRVAFRSWTKSALLVGPLMVVITNYGNIISWYGKHQIPIIEKFLSPNKIFFALTLLVAAAICYVLWRKRWAFARLVPVINVLTLALLLQFVWAIGISQFNRSLTGNPVLAETNSLEVGDGQSKLGYKPDVHYIIFDRYANQHTLQDDYQFDNSAFIDWLKGQGFYVADQAAANYPYTPLSISSSLNMSYHSRVDDDVRPYPEVATRIYPLLQQTEVADTFKNLGYRMYQMGSWFPPTHTSEMADANYVQENVLGIDHFTATFVAGTMAAPVLQHVLPEDQKVTFTGQHLSSFEYQVENFPNVADLPGPKFVFVHMLMPHSPYVVDADCSPINPDNDHRPELPKYLDQLECANLQAKAMVRHIMDSSQQKPIIILQSDEGPYTIKYKMKDSVEFQDASDDSILERARILNAYYMPDGDNGKLYPSISPVNSFRTIFSQYFGMDLPTLDDKTFVPPSRPRLLSFMDVTDVIKRWQKTVDSRQ